MNELIQLLESSLPLFTALCVILGLLVGSFLNVVIHRLPKMLEQGWQQQCADLRGEDGHGEVSTPDKKTDHPRFPHPNPLPEGEETNESLRELHNSVKSEPYNLLTPRSACPHCHHAISALENIPVISYLLLRGKCRGCGAAISPRYPIVEAVSGILCGFAAWHFGFGMTSAGALLLIWALLALTAIDFDTQLLPDDITLPLIWAGLIFNLYGAYTTLHDALLGAIFGYLALWAVYWLFKLATGKEGMGYGDFKLLAALGAWLGWQMLPLIIILSSLVGAVIGIILIVAVKRGRDIPIPFGPYLAGGGLIALFWGQTLTQNYLQLLAQ